MLSIPRAFISFDPEQIYRFVLGNDADHLWYVFMTIIYDIRDFSGRFIIMFYLCFLLILTMHYQTGKSFSENLLCIGHFLFITLTLIFSNCPIFHANFKLNAQHSDEREFKMKKDNQLIYQIYNISLQ